MVYLFSCFVDTVFEQHIETGSKVRVDLRLLRLAVNGNNCYLEPGPLGRSNLQQAPREIFEGSITYSYKEDSSEKVAALLIAEVYAWFGFEEERVPYTTSSPAGRIIDRGALASVG